jgi:serine/threonine-protein kinase HipA
MNPNELGQGLTLNITDTDNTLDLSLALNIAPHFKLKPDDAHQIVRDIKEITKQWRTLARKYEIGAGETEQVRRAFRLSGE